MFLFYPLLGNLACMSLYAEHVQVWCLLLRTPLFVPDMATRSYRGPQLRRPLFSPVLSIVVLQEPTHQFTRPEYPTMRWVKMKIRVPDVFYLNGILKIAFSVSKWPFKRLWALPVRHDIQTFIPENCCDSSSHHLTICFGVKYSGRCWKFSVVLFFFTGFSVFRVSSKGKKQSHGKTFNSVQN